MTIRLFARILIPVLVVAAGITALGEPQEKGRFKKQGDKCVWDANDSGPNQCTPVTRGRFKKEGVNCVWDAKDSGDDQCRPKSGRWKKEGNRCVWNASDSGPDQCDPRGVR